MRKRTTPKIFRRAKGLHRNLTEAEARLWARYGHTARKASIFEINPPSATTFSN